jgi:hypothetical protein
VSKPFCGGFSEAANNIPADIFVPKYPYNNTFVYGDLWSCQSQLTDSQYKPGIGEFYGILNERIPFYTKSLLIFPTVAAQDSYSTNALPYYVYRQTISRDNPLYGLESIAYDRNSTRCKLFVAALAARLPILAIAAADEKLPRVNKDGSNKKQEAFVLTNLEVKGVKVAATIGAIVCGQILAILVVLHYCRDISLATIVICRPRDC